jgi:Lon protease-like protein
MFPLSAVVFPHQEIPLLVFEPRYQQLIHDVQATDGRFGICLIARGSEVGGHDERYNVGTLVRILDVWPMAGEQYLLHVEGVARCGVDEWLVDDPYPRARLRSLPDYPVKPVDSHVLKTTESAVKALRTLTSEVNTESCIRSHCELSSDPCVRAWQLCALAPMSTLDQLKVLSIDDATERLRLVSEIACERYGDLQRQLEVDAQDA